MIKNFLKLFLIIPVIASINTVKAGYTGQPNGWGVEEDCEKTTNMIGLVYRLDNNGSDDAPNWGVHKRNSWNGKTKWIKKNTDKATAKAKFNARCS